jgi:hypothetical protein
VNAKTAIPAGIIGAVIGLAVGFTVASLRPYGASSFVQWLGLEPNLIGHPSDALAWAAGGILVALASTFLWRPNSN